VDEKEGAKRPGGVLAVTCCERCVRSVGSEHEIEKILSPPGTAGSAQQGIKSSEAKKTGPRRNRRAAEEINLPASPGYDRR
jgi:hypothetical protein